MRGREMAQEPRPIKSLALHGRRVRRWMLKNKVSMEELGRRMDPPRTRQTVSQLLVSRWPMPNTIEALARATGMSVEELTSRRHPPRPCGRPRAEPKLPPGVKALKLVGKPSWMWSEEEERQPGGEPEDPELNELED